MAGEGRIIFGLFLVVIGPFLLLTSAGLLFGIVCILGGAFLLYSGLVAARIQERVHSWRDIPRLVGLEVPQRAPRPAPEAAVQVPPAATETTSAPPVYLETDGPVKTCPKCGVENPNPAAFCRKCNAPLPPPS